MARFCFNEQLEKAIAANATKVDNMAIFFIHSFY
jgi:hypothetical protein